MFFSIKAATHLCCHPCGSPLEEAESWRGYLEFSHPLISRPLGGCSPPSPCVPVWACWTIIGCSWGERRVWFTQNDTISVISRDKLSPLLSVTSVSLVQKKWFHVPVTYSWNMRSDSLSVNTIFLVWCENNFDLFLLGVLVCFPQFEQGSRGVGISV